MAEFKSDSRLLSILQSGEKMLHHIDPEGILRTGTVTLFAYSRNQASDSWILHLVFPSSVQLHISGLLSADDTLVISSMIVLSGSTKTRIPIIGTETVLSALGDASGIPVCLKPNLSSFAPLNENNGVDVFDCRHVFEMAKDALFFRIEGGDKEGAFRGNFNTVFFSYDCMEGKPQSVGLKSQVTVAGGRITVSAQVDMYGLNRKNVNLRYDCGLGHYMLTDCFVTYESGTVPSLKLAFDLCARLGDLYSKQRKKKTGLGKPRSSSKQ